MGEFKGTKGEWKQDYQCVFIGEDHRASNFEQVIARCYPSNFYDRSDEEAEANAQLIAAAPELLEALIDLRHVILNDDENIARIMACSQKAKEAIAKALNK